MEPLPLGRCTEKIHSKQCKQWANRICSHCQREICLEHYFLHEKLVQTRTDQFHNQINDLRQRVHSLTFEKIQKKIDVWADKQRELIELKQKQMKDDLMKNLRALNVEQFCSEQLNQIDEYLEKPLRDLFKLPNQMTAIEQIENFEKQFERIQNQIEQFDSIIEITDQG